MLESRTMREFSFGRVVNWLVLALIAGSILYSVVIALLNWRAIYV